MSHSTGYTLGPRQHDQSIVCVSAAQLYLHRGKASLLGNLEIFRNRKAADPRDMVYGLLGLQDSRLSGWSIIEPDYDKTIAQVYLDVVVAAVNDGGDFRILSNVQHDDSFQHLDDFPSWAPYWPRQRSVSFIDRGKWYAGGRQPIKASFSYSYRELLAEGIIAEKIVSVSETHPKSLDEYGALHPFLDLMLELWQEYAPIDLSDDSFQSGFGKLCRTLTAGYTASGEVVYELDAKERFTFYADYLAFIHYIMQYIGQTAQLSTAPTLAATVASWERFARGVRYACRSTRIFRTESGLLGLGQAQLVLV